MKSFIMHFTLKCFHNWILNNEPKTQHLNSKWRTNINVYPLFMDCITTKFILTKINFESCVINTIRNRLAYRYKILLILDKCFMPIPNFEF